MILFKVYRLARFNLLVKPADDVSPLAQNPPAGSNFGQSFRGEVKPFATCGNSGVP
jgi:hypothetical protein